MMTCVKYKVTLCMEDPEGLCLKIYFSDLFHSCSNEVVIIIFHKYRNMKVQQLDNKIKKLLSPKMLVCFLHSK